MRDKTFKQDLLMTQFFKLTTLCLFGWTVFSFGSMTVQASADTNHSSLSDGIVIDSGAAELVAAPTNGVKTQPKLAAPAAKLLAGPTAPAPVPHCEVPCGIYADQMRFEQMLEDTQTIAKAIASVNEIADGFAQGPPSAKTVNQMTRWINTKESHASNTQHIVAQYFLTQRIKASNENYAKQLTAAHQVMVAAMKCKQDADPATAETLKKSIYDLYRAYEGKEPKFHEEK